MYRAVLACGAAAILLTCGVLTVAAQDQKTTTLEGTLTCTKCALKETPKCGHALIVKKDKKEIKYYLNDKGGAEPYHGKVCTEDKPAKVTGTIVQKGDKLYIDKPKVEINN